MANGPCNQADGYAGTALTIDEFTARYIAPAIAEWVKADVEAKAYPNGCPILPESDD